MPDPGEETLRLVSERIEWLYTEARAAGEDPVFLVIVAPHGRSGGWEALAALARAPEALRRGPDLVHVLPVPRALIRPFFQRKLPAIVEVLDAPPPPGRMLIIVMDRAHGVSVYDQAAPGPAGPRMDP